MVGEFAHGLLMGLWNYFIERELTPVPTEENSDKLDRKIMLTGTICHVTSYSQPETHRETSFIFGQEILRI